MNRQTLSAAVCVVLKVMCVLVVAAYIGMYADLSRRGMREAREFNSEGLLYVPVGEVEQSHDLTRHQYLRILFTPLNEVDQWLFGADAPVSSMMFDLS